MKKAFCLVILLVTMSSLGVPVDETEANQVRAALVLIDEFETTLYSSSRLLPHNAESKYGTSAFQAPFGYLVGGLDLLERGVFARILQHSEAVLLGAKDFRPPSRLGSVRSTSCYIMVLRDRSGFDLRQYFSTSPKLTKAGMTWAWTVKLSEFRERDSETSSLFATQVGQSYVLVCNDVGEIENLSQQLTSGKSSTARSIGLPDWSALKHYEMWCYRQYRHSGILDRGAAGMKDATTSAQALTLLVDFEGKIARLRLFATDDSTPDQINVSMKRANEAWPRLVRSTDGGMWESTIPLSPDQRTGESMFDIAALFGFGIYL